jgi:hypothetical protein
MAVTDWDRAETNSVHLAVFLQGYSYLLDRSATVPFTQLTKLLKTIFTTKPEADDNEMALNPLNRLMSLIVFTPKFTKAHLNASFSSVELESARIYKLTLINPFHYSPQTKRALVKAATSDLEEEHNEINCCINNTKKNKALRSLGASSALIP